MLIFCFALLTRALKCFWVLLPGDVSTWKSHNQLMDVCFIMLLLSYHKFSVSLLSHKLKALLCRVRKHHGLSLTSCFVAMVTDENVPSCPFRNLLLRLELRSLVITLCSACARTLIRSRPVCTSVKSAQLLLCVFLLCLVIFKWLLCRGVEGKKGELRWSRR